MSNLMTNGNTMKWLLLPAQMHCIASKQRALYLHDTPRAHAFSPAQLTWRIEQVMRAVFTFCQKTYTHTQATTTTIEHKPSTKKWKSQVYVVLNSRTARKWHFHCLGALFMRTTKPAHIIYNYALDMSRLRTKKNVHNRWTCILTVQQYYIFKQLNRKRVSACIYAS